MIMRFLIILGSIAIPGLSIIPSAAVASPAPLFKNIIPNIRRELPKSMVMRLPSFVPNVYKGISDYNGNGTKVYATGSKNSPGAEGGYNVYLSRTPDCNATSCGVGYISVSRNKPSIRDSQSGHENVEYEKSITIKPGLSGYYFYARAGSAGERHNIYWKQNGLYFLLNFRGFEKEEVKRMATSMAKEKNITPL
jgi:hypothetical protein